MFDPATIFAIVGTFLIAGTVKGVIGLGLPTVSLALLTVAFDLLTAMHGRSRQAVCRVQGA